MRPIVTRFCAILILLLPTSLSAGSNNISTPKLPAQQVAQFSNKVQQDLAARGVQVAIVSRVGRDPSVLPKGVRYTHLGFFVYSNITDAQGRTGQGYRVYNLYQTGNNATRSALVQDSPADFFAGAVRLDAGIIIPDKRLQKKLLRVINSRTYKALHNPRYSVLSNPRTGQFQNCTEHTLDVIMASVYGTSSKAQIKANISAHFKPQLIPMSGTKRTFAGFASQALTTADHGSQVSTATFGSIARFMKAHRLSDQTFRLTPKGASRL